MNFAPPPTETNDCWKRAYELIQSGADEKAAEICLLEPCASTQECQQFLGWYFLDMDDYDSALHWFKPLAEKGDAAGLYGLATAHRYLQNYNQSFELYRAAVMHGNTRAFYWTSYMYRYGLGVVQNLDEAKAHLQLSADLGYIVSKRALLDMEFREAGLFKKVIVSAKLLFLVLKAGLIAYKHENDERLVEVPNPLQKRK